MKVGIIGLGKLGLPLSLVFAKAGFEVYGVDVSETKIQQILKRERFSEPHVNEYLEKYGKNLTVSTDYNILKECEVVVIITQTPSSLSGKFDIQFVEHALRQLHKVNPNCLAVVSSNINIGTIDALSKIHKRVCYNPEFVKQGSIIYDFENPKYVVIGAYTKEDGEAVAKIWKKIHSKPIYIVKPIEAEIIKLSSNVSFALGITFANMIGELCEKYNADSNKVLDIIYQDRRNYKAGLGFMGPCFPRDVNCFRAICLENSVESGYKFANLLNDLNSYIVEKYLQKIKSYHKKNVGILGVAYKPNVPYIYDSQPLKIAEKLIQSGYQVYIYDPLAEENAKQALKNAHFCSSINECIERAEVIFIGTANYSNIKSKKPIVNPWK